MACLRDNYRGEKRGRAGTGRVAGAVARPGSHKSVRAQLRHTARQVRGSLTRRHTEYTSREWDSEIGQYFYRARYYGPGIGRFESEDPSGFSAGDTDLYRYVHNDPIGLSDPTGLQAIPDTVTMNGKGPIGGQWSPMVMLKHHPGAPAFVPGVGRFDWGADYSVRVTDSAGVGVGGFELFEVVKVVESGGFFEGADPGATREAFGTTDRNSVFQPAGADNANEKCWAAGELHQMIDDAGGWGKIVLEQYFEYGEEHKVIKHSGFALTEEVYKKKYTPFYFRPDIVGYKYFISVKREAAGWYNRKTGFDVDRGVVTGQAKATDEIK